MDNSNLAILAIISAAILGGLAGVFGKFALTVFSANTIIALRFGIALLALLPIAFALKQYRIHKKDLPLLLLSNIFYIGNIFLFIIALQYTTAIVSQIMYFLNPIIVLIISRYQFKQQINVRELSGILLGIIGGSVIVLQSFFDKSKLSQLSFGTFHGNGLLLLAVVCWSLYLTFSKKLTQKYSPILLTTYSSIAALVASLPLSIIEISRHTLLQKHITAAALIGVLLLGVCNSFLMIFLYQWANKRTSPFIISSAIYLSPVSAAIAAIPLLGERITIPLFVAAGFIAISIYLTVIYPVTKKAYNR